MYGLQYIRLEPAWELHSGFTPVLCLASSSINLFRYEAYALTGWLSGTREPVLVHKNCGNVSLVVNDYFIC